MALVSGGNRGLGLRVVGALADRGMRVVLGARSVDRGRDAIDALGGLAGRVAVRQLDITDAASVARVGSWIEERLGRCDVLVNNAAVLMDDDQGAADVDLAVVRQTLETNLLGTWRLTQAVVPLMRARRYGRIVNVSGDITAVAARRRVLAGYRLSKTAVNALTRMFADELRGERVLVNACCPDPVEVDPGDADELRLSASPETPVRLATLLDGGPTGKFYCGGIVVDA